MDKSELVYVINFLVLDKGPMRKLYVQPALCIGGYF